MGNFFPRRNGAVATAVLAALLGYYKRKQIMAWLLVKYMISLVGVPSKSFEDTPTPPALDYTKTTSWAARPGRKTFAELVPEGETAVPNNERLTDCFYVHPTGYFRGNHWNAPVPDAQADEQTNVWMLAGQASAFNSTCRIWAPHYRQACLGSYWGGVSNGRQALEFAYADVARAFVQFLAEIGPDAHFVLASHSQGGHHMVRLLEEHVDGSDAMCQRMIACYMIGSLIPLDKFTRTYNNLREGASPTDHSGVVIGWDTLADKAEDLGASLPNPGTYYKTGWEFKPGRDVLGTNPLTWTKTGRGTKTTAGYLGQMVMDSNIGRQVELQEYLCPNPMGLTSLSRLRREDPTTETGEEFWVESRKNRLAVPALNLNSLGRKFLLLLLGMLSLLLCGVTHALTLFRMDVQRWGRSCWVVFTIAVITVCFISIFEPTSKKEWKHI